MHAELRLIFVIGGLLVGEDAGLGQAKVAICATRRHQHLPAIAISQ